MSRKTFRILSFVIAVIFSCLCMSSCTHGSVLPFDQSGYVNSAIPDSELSGVPSFDEIKYERPDTEALCDEINLATQKAADIKTEEEAVSAVQDIERKAAHFYTMQAYAMVCNSRDVSDEYWQDESEYFSANETCFAKAYEKFRRAMSRTDYRDIIEREVDSFYFYKLKDFDDETYALIEKTESEISMLVNEYHEMLATAEIEYGGIKYTLNEAMLCEENGPIFKWYDTYSDSAAEIFVKLVKLRSELAVTEGYDTYIDMVFDKMIDGEYTPEMLSSLVSDIQQQVVPVFIAQRDVGFFYSTDIDISFDEWSDDLAEILFGLDESFARDFTLLRNQKYIDARPGKYREGGAYTTYLYDTEMPFLFMSFNNDENSIGSLIHETGHCIDYLTDHQKSYTTLDTEEIFSTAMELLVSNHYTEYFNLIRGYEMQYNTLSSAFQTYIFQGYLTALELEIYSMDPEDITVDILNETALECSKRFGLCEDGSEELYRHDWIRIDHMFRMPFYVASYITSGYAALQIWEISLDNEKRAVEIYRQLLGRKGGYRYHDNITCCGLESPFEPGAMKKVADFGEKYLIDRNWT